MKVDAAGLPPDQPTMQSRQVLSQLPEQS